MKNLNSLLDELEKMYGDDGWIEIEVSKILRLTRIVRAAVDMSDFIRKHADTLSAHDLRCHLAEFDRAVEGKE